MSEPMPTLAEISALLSRYFVGATEAAAQRLHDEVRDVLAAPARHAAEASAFDPGNGGRGFGQAWREELAFDHRSPNPLELAAWLAATGDNYPMPRPYCPDKFVGTWQQRTAGPQVRWQFSVDGTFICDEPLLRARIRWCVHRQSAKGPVGDVLWLDDDLGIAHKNLLVMAASPAELRLQLPGTSTEYTLVRT
jgi:hypothetical protein